MNATTYPGGKAGAGVVQTLINEIPPHSVYIAACAGFDAIARTKRPADLSVLIDLDEITLAALAELLEAAWGDQVGSLGLRRRFELLHTDGVAWLRHRFALDRVFHGPPKPRIPSRPIGPEDEAGAFVYLDPPYPESTRSGRDLYRYEMTDEQHAALLKTATALPCPVMVSSYANPMYAEALADWRKIEFQAMTRGGVRTESLWMNYPRPARLHDHRFVGQEKRERERVRRRVRNWLGGLERAEPMEREAMLEAIREHYPRGEADQ